MPKFLRMLLAIVLGVVVGSVINMALIALSGKVIPPPAGADVTTMAGLKASLLLFEPKHFLFLSGSPQASAEFLSARFAAK